MQHGTRAMVQVDIVSKKLGNRIIPVNFLIDTGADITTISPLCALTNEIDFSKLRKKKEPSVGIGGTQICEYEIDDVGFRFMNLKGKPIYEKLECIDVIEPDLEAEIGSNMFKIPNLLGTDMLKKLKLTYNSHCKLEVKK